MLKKYSALAIIVASGICFLPDVTSLKTCLFAVACACLISVAFAMVIGSKSGWGVFPDFDFGDTIRRATRTPESCAEVLKGFLVFLGLALIAIFKAQ